MSKTLSARLRDESLVTELELSSLLMEAADAIDQSSGLSSGLPAMDVQVLDVPAKVTPEPVPMPIPVKVHEPDNIGKQRLSNAEPDLVE